MAHFGATFSGWRNAYLKNRLCAGVGCMPDGVREFRSVMRSEFCYQSTVLLLNVCIL